MLVDAVPSPPLFASSIVLSFGTGHVRDGDTDRAFTDHLAVASREIDDVAATCADGRLTLRAAKRR